MSPIGPMGLISEVPSQKRRPAGRTRAASPSPRRGMKTASLTPPAFFTMSKQQLDALISSMFQAVDGVSDLLFVVNRPPQIEVYGKLRSVEVDPRFAMLTPSATEQIAVTLMNG